MAEHKARGQMYFAGGMIAGTVAGYVIHDILGPHQALLTSKLLDWPFLTFILVACLVAVFFESLTAAISRGELTIGWGKDQSISIRNLSSAVGGELDPIKEDVAYLKETLAALQLIPRVKSTSETNEISPSEKPLIQLSISEDESSEAKVNRLKEALSNPKYKWRTIERLASLVASPEKDVISLLLTMDDVRLSRSMTGNEIAGLRMRVGAA